MYAAGAQYANASNYQGNGAKCFHFGFVFGFWCVLIDDSKIVTQPTFNNRR